jgi:competence protein ComGB
MNTIVGCLKMKRRKWTLEEQSWFLKMTGELLTRGYPLSEALNSIIYHLPNRHKDDIMEGLLSLKEGCYFYQILEKLEFNDHLIGYVYYAEQHGGLAAAFLDGSKMMEKRAKDWDQFKKLLAYPLFLILTTLILFFFVDKILLPRFSSLFTSMNVKANFFTNVIYYFGEILPFLFSILFILILLFVFYYLFVFRKLKPIEQKSRLVRIPLIADFFRLFYTYYFSIQLSYLLTGGLSVNEALSMFARNDGQHFYKELGIDIKRSLIQGEKLEGILGEYPFFERELAIIVKHGQDNGKLDQELSFFAAHCLQNLEEKTEKMMKKLQPLMYLLIGFFIVSMYLAVLLPMFHLMDGI